ncbi:MAG: response regulator transcription factor [Prevotella sp.]|nr:response regulator transcription factor [Prevotella sp.]
MQNILVVEDEKRVASLLKKGLEENGYSVVVAFDGAMGLRLFQSGRFDLVVSDVVLPNMHGFDLCKAIKAVNANVPVMIVTALGSTDDKLDGFDAGADDYMTKPFDFRELLARVRALLKRGSSAKDDAPARIEYSDLAIDLNTQEVWRGTTLVKLSPKEYNLLLYMVEHAEKVVSRIAIAEEVWHTHFDTGTNFIDVYINYLRKKIDKEFPVKLIHTKPGVGFILSDKL